MSEPTAPARLNVILRPEVDGGTMVTDFGYALAVSRFDDGYLKVSLVARPHRVLGRMRIALATGRASPTLVALPSRPTMDFRWWGALDLEVANRTLEAQYRASAQKRDRHPQSGVRLRTESSDS